MADNITTNYEFGEVSLVDLFLHLWAVRVPVVATLIVVSLGYWSYSAFKQITTPIPPKNYSSFIQFTFKGVETGKYPNGTEFRLADIISPAVLDLVYKSNKLDQQKVNLEKFVSAFNIQPYAPDYEMAVTKYKIAMERKGISSEEISKLQIEMKNELDIITSQMAIISFTSSNEDLPESVVKDVLLDVPKLWAEKAIKEDGVLKLDIEIYSNKIFDESAFAKLDYLVSIELLLKNIDYIRSNIKLLLEKPNGPVVVDDQSGYNLSDLEKNLNDLVEFEVKQLIAPIKKLGISKNKETVRLFYKEKISRLRLQKTLYLKKSQVISAALEGYMQKNPGAISEVKTFKNQGELPFYSSSPQFGDSFLEKIIDLSEKSGDLRFRQELSLRKIEYEEKAAGIDHELSQFQEILANIESSHDKETAKLVKYYTEEITRVFPEVLNKLRSYIDVTNRISEKLASVNIGETGQLYSNIGQQSIINGQGRLFSKSNLITFAIIIFLSFSLSSLVFIICNSCYSKEKVNSDTL